MKTAKGFLVAVFCLLSLLPMAWAAEYEIQAQVDKTEVAFGDSLTLAITISQELGMGGTARSLTPNLKEIPGFDIASSRTGQSTSFINGYGQMRSQVVYELVPREAGKKTIPAISFTDPEGKVHSTKPIEITVLPPESEPETRPEEERAVEEKSDGISIFNVLLLLGLAFAFIIALFVVFSVFLSRRPTFGYDKSEQSSSSETGPDIADAQIIEESAKDPVEVVRVDFAAELSRLKKQWPEADNEFYQELFALFKRACISQSSALREDMTPDELFEKISQINGTHSVKTAAVNLARDVEAVMYARSRPGRNLTVIEDDMKLLLAGID